MKLDIHLRSGRVLKVETDDPAFLQGISDRMDCEVPGTVTLFFAGRKMVLSIWDIESVTEIDEALAEDDSTEGLARRVADLTKNITQRDEMIASLRAQLEKRATDRPPAPSAADDGAIHGPNGGGCQMATDDRIFQLCIYMSGGGEIEMLVEREELRAFEESVLAQPQPRTFEFGIDDTGRLIVLLEHVRAYDSFVEVAHAPTDRPPAPSAADDGAIHGPNGGGC